MLRTAFRRAGPWLALIALLALGLRIAGIHWGLPDELHPVYSWHPDETALVVWARWLAQGHIVAKQFIFGGTLCSSLINGYYHLGMLLGPMLRAQSDLAATLLVGRWFTVGLSLLTILIVYETGRRAFGIGTGLLAALLLSLAPVHVFLADNIRPDTAAALFAALTVYVSQLILQADRERDLRFFIFAGLLIGAATALRFPLATFGAAPLCALMLRERPAGPGQVLALALSRRMLALVAAAAAGYALCSPHSFLYPQALFDGLQVQWRYQSGSFPDAIGRGPGVYQYGWLTLREALGTPLYVLAAGGLLLSLARARRSPALLVLLAAFVPYFALSTFTSWVMVRYMVPLVPILALLAAAVVTWAWDSRPQLRPATALAFAGVVLWTLAGDLAFLRLQAGRNVRDLAADWIGANAAPDSRFTMIELYAGDVYLNPVVPPPFVQQAFVLVAGADPRTLLEDDDAYLVLNGFTYKSMERLGSRHPVQEIQRLQAVLDREYTLVTEIDPPARFAGIDFSGRFTSQDYAIVNPGIRIYRRRQAGK